MTRFYLVQTELVWEDPAANRRHFDDVLSECLGGVVVLPEMFTTGFSMASARLAETMEGETVQWMRSTASALNSAICGSQIIRSNNQHFNRFLWVGSAGELVHYDKRHLFRIADEHDYYSAGSHRVTFNSSKENILPQVCYDLRFPAFSRNLGDYDIMLFVANWPAARREQWLTLLKARAIENLSYVVAVNRVGRDGNQIYYSGDSCVIDFRGQVLLEMGDAESIAQIDLDLPALYEYRRNFPAHLDADEFDLHL